MANENETNNNSSQSQADAIKGWMMVILTLIFVLLYVSALFSLIPKLEDASIITRLEPIIFVIIGYYFGRIPAQANENTLKDEIKRQSRKADAAQQLKEKVQQEREILEEKIKNARITLAPSISGDGPVSGREKMAASSAEMPKSTKQVIETAVKILDS